MSKYDDEVREIERVRHNISQSVRNYEATASNLVPELYRDVRTPLGTAIAGLTHLGEIVVDIPSASGQTRRDLISAAKSLSSDIVYDFQTVVNLGEYTRKKFDVVRTDVTHKQGLAERTFARADGMTQEFDVLKENAQKLADERAAAIEQERRELKESEDLKKKSEATYAKMEEIKQSWYGPFTFGISGPMKDLRDDIERHQKIGDELHQSIDDTLLKLLKNRHDYNKFSNFERLLTSTRHSLQALGTTLDKQHTQIDVVVKIAFDVSVFVGNLYSYSSPLEDMRSPVDIAGQIKKLQDEIGTNEKLSGPFLDNPHLLTEGLKAILDSGNVQDDLI